MFYCFIGCFPLEKFIIIIICFILPYGLRIPFTYFKTTQDVIEMCDQILTTSYWLRLELGKNI
jgi:hypothetical protein